jgi:hypothetical protein
LRSLVEAYRRGEVDHIARASCAAGCIHYPSQHRGASSRHACSPLYQRTASVKVVPGHARPWKTHAQGRGFRGRVQCSAPAGVRCGARLAPAPLRPARATRSPRRLRASHALAPRPCCACVSHRRAGTPPGRWPFDSLIAGNRHFGRDPTPHIRHVTRRECDFGHNRARWSHDPK